MKRRELLAGAIGVSVLGGGAAYAYRSLEDESIEPVTIEQIDDSGATAGEMRVPERGQPTVLTFFATWCSTCRRTMPEAVEARESTGDVQFVSVSNEAVGQTTTREDVADWWQSHGGDWPVGIDTDLELTGAFDVRGVPHAVVLDADNRVVYDESGEKSATDLISAVESV